MRPRILLAVVVLSVMACTGTAESTTTASATDTTPAPGEATTTISEAGTTTTVAEEPASEDPCALVTGEQVAAVFVATSASGEPGIARNCSFTVVDGLAPSVEVFHYGQSSAWDGVKAGFVDNRGGVTDIAGLGDEAFQPNDVGPYEVVVRSGDIIFSVAVQTGGGGPEVEAAILDLAGVIAGG